MERWDKETHESLPAFYSRWLSYAIFHKSLIESNRITDLIFKLSDKFMDKLVHNDYATFQD